jgi:hypothetical protein
LLELVWKCRPWLLTRTVDQTVATLRKKIEFDPGHPQFLQTVYGRPPRQSQGDPPSNMSTRFDKLVAGESVEHAGPGGLGPNGIHGGNPRSFGTIEPIKSFVAVRAQSIADQLAGKSEGKIINGNSE